MQLALPDPRFQSHPGSRGLADRQRGGSWRLRSTSRPPETVYCVSAERADVIVDFTYVALGNHVLGNVGPDEPFGGGVPGIDFDVADPATTGQVMQFRVVPAVAPDPTTPPQFLVLPPVPPLPVESVTRRLALIEEMSKFVVDTPAEAELGTVEWDAMQTSAPGALRMDARPSPRTRRWCDRAGNCITSRRRAPIHIHEVVFEVVNRQDIVVFKTRSRFKSTPHRRRRRRSPGRLASRTP